MAAGAGLLLTEKSRLLNDEGLLLALFEELALAAGSEIMKHYEAGVRVEHKADASPVTEADRAAAFQKLIAYSGRYRLEPPNRFITSVDVAWYQPWLEKEQARSFALDGDMLDITSDPTTTPLSGDALVVGLLSWRRETIAG